MPHCTACAGQPKQPPRKQGTGSGHRSVGEQGTSSGYQHVCRSGVVAARPLKLLEWMNGYAFCFKWQLKKWRKEAEIYVSFSTEWDPLIHNLLWKKPFLSLCWHQSTSMYFCQDFINRSYYCHVSCLAGNLYSKTSTIHKYSHSTSILASELIYQHIANILPNETQAHFLHLDLCSSIHSCPKPRSWYHNHLARPLVM